MSERPWTQQQRVFPAAFALRCSATVNECFSLTLNWRGISVTECRFSLTSDSHDSIKHSWRRPESLKPSGATLQQIMFNKAFHIFVLTINVSFIPAGLY